MSEHKLESGKQLIAALVALGEALEYHVEPEYAIDEAQFGTPPAVDVAWFAMPGQHFPLMIFEVESTPSNSSANNPLKVYGQPTSKFQKPLFFFHIILSGGEHSTRIDTLKHQYGSHNYRLYRLGLGEGEALAIDVLEQHRRISDTFDYLGVWRAMSRDIWDRIAGRVEVLEHAYRLGLSPAERLTVYFRLARTEPDIAAKLTTAITQDEADGRQGFYRLPGRLGPAMHWPIVCALMMYLGNEPDQWNDKIILWQNSGELGRRIWPAFGLSQDHDFLLLHIVAPVVALCAALAREVGSFVSVLVDALVEMLACFDNDEEAVPLATWICHLAAACKLNDHFAKARDYLRVYGRTTLSSLMEPGWAFDDGTKAVELDLANGGGKLCPEMNDFRECAKEYFREHPADPTSVALDTLLMEELDSAWGFHILRSLWTDSLAAA